MPTQMPTPRATPGAVVQAAAELPRFVWLAAARPQTLAVGVAPVVLATALAASCGHFVAAVLGCALGGSVAIQIGTNLFNDWADGARGTDGEERLGPLRMTQRGVLPARRVLWASGLCFGVAALLGLKLVALGGLPVLAVGTASVAAGVLYTGGPYPLAYHGLGDVFAFVFFGPVPVVTTYWLHCGHTSPEAWAWGLALGAFSAAVLAVNNLRDRFTDAKANKNTLAVRLGERATRVQYTVLLALPYLVAAGLAVHTRLAHLPAWQLAPLATLPSALRCGQALWQLDGAALNPWLGKTARLEAAFAALASFACLLGHYLGAAPR